MKKDTDRAAHGTRLFHVFLIVVLLFTTVALTGCDWLEELFGGGGGEETDFNWTMYWQEGYINIYSGDIKDIGSCEAGSSLTVNLELKNTGGDSFKVTNASITNNSGNAFTLGSQYTGEIGPDEAKSYSLSYNPTTSDSSECQASLTLDIENQDQIVFTFKGTWTTSGGGGSITLAPPEWTIGTWRDVTDNNIYTFSSDNVVGIYSGSTTIDFNVYNSTYYTSGAYYEDTIVDSGTYKMEGWNGGSIIQVLLFVNNYDNTLNYSVDGGTIIVLTKD